MLVYEKTETYEGCVDHHLTIPLGDDNFIDLIMTIAGGSYPTLTVIANQGGTIRDDKAFTINISDPEAARILAMTR